MKVTRLYFFGVSYFYNLNGQYSEALLVRHTIDPIHQMKIKNLLHFNSCKSNMI